MILYVPSVLYVVGLVVVPVISPEHGLVAVGAVTVAEHCPVMAGNVAIVGWILPPPVGASVKENVPAASNVTLENNRNR